MATAPTAGGETVVTGDRAQDPVLVLRLFVSGDGPLTATSRRQLDRLCERVGIRHRVEIVDVDARPDLAETHLVTVTPTLERVLPHPVLRVAGDLTDLEGAMNGLGLRVWQIEPAEGPGPAPAP